MSKKSLLLCKEAKKKFFFECISIDFFLVHLLTMWQVVLTLEEQI